MQTGSIIKLRNTLIINVYGVEQLQEWAVAAYKKKIKIINSCEIKKKVYICTYLNEKAHKVWHSQNNSYVDFVMATTTAATSTSVHLFWWNYFCKICFFGFVIAFAKNDKSHSFNAVFVLTFYWRSDYFVVGVLFCYWMNISGFNDTSAEFIKLSICMYFAYTNIQTYLRAYIFYFF